MAKSGRPSRLLPEGRSGATRRTLVAAAIDTLKNEGYAGASARAIARRADCNQALIFYHFGSVAALLLAALDEISATRLVQYRASVERVKSPAALAEAAAAIFREDLDAGYVKVLVEMIAGAASTPGLGPEVAERIRPWTEFAQEAIDGAIARTPIGSLIPSSQIAYGIVALYLGLEMLSHLDGDREPALALFDQAKKLAGIIGGLTPGATTS